MRFSAGDLIAQRQMTVMRSFAPMPVAMTASLPVAADPATAPPPMQIVKPPIVHTATGTVGLPTRPPAAGASPVGATPTADAATPSASIASGLSMPVLLGAGLIAVYFIFKK